MTIIVRTHSDTSGVHQLCDISTSISYVNFKFLVRVRMKNTLQTGAHMALYFLEISKHEKNKTISHNIPQYPTISHNIPQYPTISHNIPQYHTISHNIPQYHTITKYIHIHSPHGDFPTTKESHACATSGRTWCSTPRCSSQAWRHQALRIIQDAAINSIRKVPFLVANYPRIVSGL